MARRKQRNPQDEQIQAILDQLAKGVAPWAKPWQCLGGQKNACTGRPYQGGNAFYLACVAESQGYGTPLWVTAKQAAEMGGRVKGRVCTTIDGELVETQASQWEKSWVVMWFRPQEYVKKDSDGKPILNENGEPKTGVYFKHGVKFVYNVEQTTVDPKSYEKLLPVVKSNHERNEDIEAFLVNAQGGAGFELTFGGDRAYYLPAMDKVNVPKEELYAKIEEFYSTQFHEFGHATGHQSRLNRKLGAKVTSKDDYAYEELVAELTAAIIGAEFQIDGQCQHAEYLGAWFKVLNNDNQAFHRAAGQAKKAVAYLKEAAKKGATASPEEVLGNAKEAA
jgi:antirestriction protein ArdC